MISRPNTVYPNNQAVDAKNQNIFSFQFIGDIMSAYQITVFDSVNYSPVYTGSKKTETAYNGDTVQEGIPADSLKNGLDLLWKVTIWQAIPNILVVNGVVQSGSTSTSIKIRQHPQLKVNMYLKIGSQTSKIISYDLKTGIATVETAFNTVPIENTPYSIMTDFVESAYFFFWTRTTPVVTIPEIGILSTRKVTVRPTYTQAEGTPIKYQRYVLSLQNGEIIDDSGEIATSNLEYNFDALVSGQTYVLSFGVITQDDITAETYSVFSVDYAPPRIEFPPKLTFIPEKNAVLVQWFKDLQSIGNATGGGKGEGWDIVQNFPFVGTNSVKILKGEIVYDEINGNPITQFEESNQYFIAISTVLNAGFTGKIVGVSDDVSEHYIKVNGGEIIQVKPDGQENKISEIFPKKESAIQEFLENYKSDTFYYIPENINVLDGWYMLESGSEFFDRNSFKIEIQKNYLEYNAFVTRIPIT